jgi:HlyD family secretion protein
VSGNVEQPNKVVRKKKSKKKLFIILGAALVVVILVVVNLSRSSEKGQEVTAGFVERGDIVSKVTATGRVKPKTEVKIQASVQATITQLPAEEGDTVKAGDLLVELDQTRYEAAVRMAKATLSSAKATLKQNEANMLEAKLTADRAEKLFAQGLMSEELKISAETGYEVAKALYESAGYQVDQYSASVTQAEDQLSKTILRSPMSGVVTELNAEVGEIVLVGTMNNPGTVIMTVSDLSVIEVEAEVDETDIASLRLGQNAKIKVDAFQDTSFAGIVTEIGNAAKISGFSSGDQVTNFLVNVQFVDAYEYVKPGMTAEVEVTTDEHFDVLHVPIQAVVMRDKLPAESDSSDAEASDNSGAMAAEEPTADDKKKDAKSEDQEYEGVFVIEDGKASFVQVTTGIADQRNIEITSGLSDSTQVVVGPYRILRKLDHGDDVKIIETAGEEE